tara:strand:- start:5076 stop:5369 length:294 start_codon:yes stop_codon:yes gene_type:complete
MKDRRKRKILSITDLTSEFYEKENIKKGINKVELLKTWNSITDEKIQSRTNRIFTKEDKVFIEISSSPLRNELENHKKNILIKIQKKHPSITVLQFI